MQTGTAVNLPPVEYPADRQAQTAFESGWYQQTAKQLESERNASRAEVARLRELVLEAVTRLENGGDVEDVTQFLADGRWPS